MPHNILIKREKNGTKCELCRGRYSLVIDEICTNDKIYKVQVIKMGDWIGKYGAVLWKF